MEPSFSYRLLRAASRLYGRADRLADRLLGAARNGVGALLFHALSARERSDLGADLYDLRLRESQDLHPWETAWFSLRLPAPPARLLVGGAGTGREASALIRLGYDVDALEPAPRAALACARALDGKGECVRARYEDLSAAVLEDRQNPATPLAQRRYQAVVLGWSSLVHVIDPEERRRALLACDRLTPDGPILASFWLQTPSRSAMGRGRAGALGRRVGVIIRTLRGVAPVDGSYTEFSPLCGFAHAPTVQEIDALAKEMGRTLAWEGAPGDYPHVSFLPRESD